MKKDTDNINSRLPRTDGMTVPDGYFDDFAARMTSMLPDRPELDNLMEGGKPAVVNRTLWQRVRPYVYMAAMFAGVWCMLKLFTVITTTDPVPFESNPIVAEALSNDSFVNDYILTDLNQWDLYDDLMNDGVSPDAFLDSDTFSQMDFSAEYMN